jgi:hypothetical protein
MPTKSLFTALVVLLAQPLRADSAAVELFNGKDLSGWVQRGGKAKYAVEDGVIVGTAVPGTPNSFLCTEKTYGDFVLEYDFKVDPRLNSGVQVRSECFDEAKEITVNGKPMKMPAGRVHGYQLEIDPSARRWTAGIYEEGVRSWLNPVKPDDSASGKLFTGQGKRLFKEGEWNHVRFEARGDSLKTWLNGELRAEIKDARTARGFIGLQVHGIAKELAGAQVHFKGIKLTELDGAAPVVSKELNTLTAEEKAAGWKLLWDGKTTDGWKSAKADAFPTKGWEIKDGVLSVLAGNNGAEAGTGGDIITKERYSSFELVADFRITPGANSGIKYFVQPGLSSIDSKGVKTTAGSSIGCEFQLLDDERHPDAKLGKNGNRTIGSLYDLITAAASKKPNAIGEWNTARIIVKGSKVEHWLNGANVVGYDRNSAKFRETVAGSKYHTIAGFGEWPEGHILLQDHGNNASFRNVKIRVLSAE